MALDFIVTDQASVWVFEPVTENARKFIREHASFDECLWQDQALVVDYRDAGALNDDLLDEGFVVIARH